MTILEEHEDSFARKVGKGHQVGIFGCFGFIPIERIPVVFSVALSFVIFQVV